MTIPHRNKQRRLPREGEERKEIMARKTDEFKAVEAEITIYNEDQIQRKLELVDIQKQMRRYRKMAEDGKQCLQFYEKKAPEMAKSLKRCIEHAEDMVLTLHFEFVGVREGILPTM